MADKTINELSTANTLSGTETLPIWQNSGTKKVTVQEIADLADQSAPVQSVNSQTGVVILGKAEIGLANVDNTSDLNKPISTSTQTALNTKYTNTPSSSDIALEISTKKAFKFTTMSLNERNILINPIVGMLIFIDDVGGGQLQYFDGEDWVAVKHLVSVPLTASATGIAGDQAYDSNYFYVCVAPNTWLRAALSTF